MNSNHKKGYYKQNEKLKSIDFIKMLTNSTTLSTMNNGDINKLIDDTIMIEIVSKIPELENMLNKLTAFKNMYKNTLYTSIVLGLLIITQKCEFIIKLYKAPCRGYFHILRMLSGVDTFRLDMMGRKTGQLEKTTIKIINENNKKIIESCISVLDEIHFWPKLNKGLKLEGNVIPSKYRGADKVDISNSIISKNKKLYFSVIKKNRNLIDDIPTENINIKYMCKLLGVPLSNILSLSNILFQFMYKKDLENNFDNITDKHKWWSTQSAKFYQDTIVFDCINRESQPLLTLEASLVTAVDNLMVLEKKVNKGIPLKEPHLQLPRGKVCLDGCWENNTYKPCNNIEHVKNQQLVLSRWNSFEVYSLETFSVDYCIEDDYKFNKLKNIPKILLASNFKNGIGSSNNKTDNPDQPTLEIHIWNSQITAIRKIFNFIIENTNKLIDFEKYMNQPSPHFAGELKDRKKYRPEIFDKYIMCIKWLDGLTDKQSPGLLYSEIDNSDELYIKNITLYTFKKYKTAIYWFADMLNNE
jgi:hypothetical protein